MGDPPRCPSGRWSEPRRGEVAATAHHRADRCRDRRDGCGPYRRPTAHSASRGVLPLLGRARVVLEAARCRAPCRHRAEREGRARRRSGRRSGTRSHASSPGMQSDAFVGPKDAPPRWAHCWWSCSGTSACHDDLVRLVVAPTRTRRARVARGGAGCMPRSPATESSDERAAGGLVAGGWHCSDDGSMGDGPRGRVECPSRSSPGPVGS